MSADGTTYKKCFFISFGNYITTLAHRTQLRVGWKVASFVDEDGVSTFTIIDCFKDVRGHIFVTGIVFWVVGNDERMMSTLHRQFLRYYKPIETKRNDVECQAAECCSPSSTSFLNFGITFQLCGALHFHRCRRRRRRCDALRRVRKFLHRWREPDSRT